VSDDDAEDDVSPPAASVGRQKPTRRQSGERWAMPDIPDGSEVMKIDV
jgi:hypothetical protein